MEGAGVKDASTEPIAIKTMLDWVIRGNKIGSDKPLNFSVISLYVSCEQPLESLVQKFWEQEEIPSKPMLSIEDQKCEDHFVSTHSRTTEGCYMVRLAFEDRSNRFIII